MNPIKKAVIIFSVPMAVLFILSCVTFAITLNLAAKEKELRSALTDNGNDKTIRNQKDISAYEIAQNEGSFVLREYEGVIGIFGQNGELIEKIAVYTRTLPASDRQALSEGIFASSREELISLIEDFSD